MKKEDDQASKERLEKIKHELADLKEKARELKTIWQSEKDKIKAIRATKEEIESAKI